MSTTHVDPALPPLQPAGAAHSPDIVPTRATPSEFRRYRPTAGDEELRFQVRKLLHPEIVNRADQERRREKRRPYPSPFRITPFDDRPLMDKQLVVVGKTLSELGVDFYHREPLPYRTVIASFDQLDGEAVHLLLDLTWCRFCQRGIYDSGGRFLKCHGTLQ